MKLYAFTVGLLLSFPCFTHTQEMKALLYQPAQTELSITDQVMRNLRSQDIQFIDVTFSDVLGNLKEITVPTNKIGSALKYGMFIDGSSIKGFTQIFESDLCLELDLESLSVSPWQIEGIKTGRFFCTVVDADGNPFANDPRAVLQKEIENARTMGYTCLCGTELEFFLFKKDGSVLIPVDNNGYCDVETNARMKAFKETLVYALNHLGLDIEKIHHEVATGQLEVVLSYTNPLELADRIQLAKHTIIMFAAQSDYTAVFMPKPIKGINGSGMHIHVSLMREDGQNAFYDATKENYLSDEARSFITGLLERAPEINLLFNFDVNSAKRLVPGYEAPVFLCCGSKNRSAAIRVPDVSKAALEGTNGKPVRIELRWPDASCNPYLALAGLFRAGLEGIKNQAAPTPFINTNLYHISQQDRETLGIKTLPATFRESIVLFEKSDFAQQLLGSSLHHEIAKLKRAELESFKAATNPLAITQWEHAHSTGLKDIQIKQCAAH